MSGVKWLFMHARQVDLSHLIDELNFKSKELRVRGEQDPEIRKLRNSYYVHEMLVFLCSVGFNVFFVFEMFIQLLFERPRQLIIPATVVPGMVDHYYVSFIVQFSVSLYVSAVMTSANVMIGNIYNQIIMHLDILHYDCQLLDSDDFVTPTQLAKRILRLLDNYQSVAALIGRCNNCMRPLFLNDVIAMMTAIIFSCVELGVVINDDVKACARPILYFIFVNLMFLYWCWLGDRLAEKVIEVYIVIMLETTI